MDAVILLLLAAAPFLTAEATQHSMVPQANPEGSMVKRSDDPTPFETVVMQHSTSLDKLNAQVAALQAKLDTKDQHVAFLAQFSSGDVTAPASGPYHFDHAVFNDGNAFDPATGIFTAPVAGVYLFTAQFFTKGGQASRPLMDILVNGVTKARLAFEEDGNDQKLGSESDSTSFTVKLQARDRVWAASAIDTEVYHLWGVYHTFFSGALLYSQ